MSRYSDFTDRTIRCLNAALYLGYELPENAPAKVADRLVDLQGQIIWLEHEGPELREFAAHYQSPPPPVCGIVSESRHGIALGLAKWVCMDVLLAAYDPAGTGNLKSIPGDKSDLPQQIETNWPAVSAALARIPEINLAELHVALRDESVRTERAAQRLEEQSKPRGTPADQGGGDNDPERPSKEALALAVLADHPDWSDTQIAKKAGCNRTTLYTFKKFMAAREILRQGKNDLPRGSKFPDEGVEAWDNGDGG